MKKEISKFIQLQQFHYKVVVTIQQFNHSCQKRNSSHHSHNRNIKVDMGEVKCLTLRTSSGSLHIINLHNLRQIKVI